jgi:hypothetical protein
MGASIVGDATDSLSVSQEYWMFPIPAKCFVTGGAITASVPSGAGHTIQVGTEESASYFGTYTVSSGAALQTRLAIYGPVTVSTSDDHLPYQRPVLVTVTAISTTTTSVSVYLLLEYVMPGNLP